MLTKWLQANLTNAPQPESNSIYTARGLEIKGAKRGCDVFWWLTGKCIELQYIFWDGAMPQVTVTLKWVKWWCRITEKGWHKQKMTARFQIGRESPFSTLRKKNSCRPTWISKKCFDGLMHYECQRKHCISIKRQPIRMQINNGASGGAHSLFDWAERVKRVADWSWEYLKCIRYAVAYLVSVRIP